MSESERGEGFVKWAKLVKERDNYICQVCGKYNTEIHAHHMNSWDIYVDDRYKIQNGASLCAYCHQKFHQIFGKGSNTKEQFLQFKEIASIIRNLMILKAKSSS